MNDSGNIKISDIEDLYSILPEEFREEFSIGFHGFSDRNYLGKAENGQQQIDENKIQQAKYNILSQGLKFKETRKLLSTVIFGEGIEDYITNDGYPAGVIVALPKVLRSESGEEMFIGTPNEDRIIEEFRDGKRRQWDRNREVTSLSELVLPGEGVLDSMFIIGTYTKNDYGIEVAVNQKHIAFNDCKVPDDFFKEKSDKLTEMISEQGVEAAIIKETIEQQEMYSGYFNPKDFKEMLSNSNENLIDSNDTYSGISQDKVERLRMAIEEMRRAGINDETIVAKLGINQVMKFPGHEQYNIMQQIYMKYEIDDIKEEDFMANNFKQSDEMRDLIAELMKQPDQESEMQQRLNSETENLTQEENISLTQFGEKSYKYFGKKIAEKFKEMFKQIRSKFFVKDMGQNKTDDLNNER